MRIHLRGIRCDVQLRYFVFRCATRAMGCIGNTTTECTLREPDANGRYQVRLRLGEPRPVEVTQQDPDVFLAVRNAFAQLEAHVTDDARPAVDGARGLRQCGS